MTTFLQDVAQSLLQRFGVNMSQVTVVFPGKRAGLFLNQALIEASGTPVWAPQYVTISDLFQVASSYELADSVETICLLYDVYQQLFKNAKTLDQFYSWGELLLSDFDDIDKHCVNAQQLFENIHDWEALKNTDFLSEKQVQTLQTFFNTFSPKELTKLKQNFLQIWEKMYDLYDGLNKKMTERNILYEGALQRRVVEQLRDDRMRGEVNTTLFPAHQQYVFVGFNVLNEVEKSLFDELLARDQATFYWDYDLFYVPEKSHENGFSTEAGYFIRKNMERYGNALDATHFDNMRHPKEVRIVAASTENIQTSYMAEWLSGYKSPSEDAETSAAPSTAVVLCNEQLLQPVLHTIPANVCEKNITMGYPMSDTPIYAFIGLLLDFVVDGYNATNGTYHTRQLKALTSHPFTALLEEQQWRCHPADQKGTILYLVDILESLGKYFTAKENAIVMKEAIFQCYKMMVRLQNLMATYPQLSTLNPQLLRHLIHSVLQGLSIPFHGEPAVGLQIMGVLETRCLDFDHLLMLSVGEGYLPKKVSDTSLIPYALKEGYGLSTTKRKVAVYAYYFYRLISRASHVTFVYNNSAAGLKQNEISRFLRQLMAETDWNIQYEQLEADCAPSQIDAEQAPSDIFSDTYLSPTGINTYTECKLKFYYKYVKSLIVEKDPEEGMDAILFGNVFHKAAELTYKALTQCGNTVRREDIETLLENHGEKLRPFEQQAIKEEIFKGKNNHIEGIHELALQVVHSYLQRLLQRDLAYTPFDVISVEKSYSMSLGGTTIGGKIDRVDSILDSDTGQRVFRVVDYKTGSVKLNNVKFESLFDTTSSTDQQQHYYFQTLLYAIMIAKEQHCDAVPCLYYLRNSVADFPWKITIDGQRVDGVQDISDDFLQRLENLIDEIKNPEIPFAPTTSFKACEHCDYRLLCGK